jgi:hypothetical protein
VTLSNDEVLKTLTTKFVCGNKNIKGEKYSGRSGEHDTDDAAVYTTNGAGPRNMQIFLLSSDGTVLHCLPGFWSPQDLLFEIEFALELDKLWRDSNLTLEAKKARFSEAHLNHVCSHSTKMMSRSKLQGFDAKFEKKREEKKGDSDFVMSKEEIEKYWDKLPGMKGDQEGMKTCDIVMHERMAARPFVKYDEFDVEKFSDYGLKRYCKCGEKFGIDHIGENGKKKCK